MTDWPGYLADYHAERPGITEDLLTLARDGGLSPYSWAGEAVPGGGTVLDLCCGSGPMRPHLTPDRYVGMDLSASELARAQGLPVVRADASRLPLADASVTAVVISMALQLVPWFPTLAEVRRVLRPGGLLVATVPANQPLSAGDWVRYGRLSVALRIAGPSYPNDAALKALDLPGLRLESDVSRAFLLDVSTPERADLLLDSLYLPEVSAERIAAGRAVVRRWVGKQVAVPIRRLVLAAV